MEYFQISHDCRQGLGVQSRSPTCVHAYVRSVALGHSLKPPSLVVGSFELPQFAQLEHIPLDLNPGDSLSGLVERVYRH
jgi:hypothetical protein